MMFDCEKHGLQSAVMVSADLLADRELAATSIYRIGFADDDAVIGVMLVSSTVAAKSGVSDGSVIQLELRSKLPEWAESIKQIVCVKCFEDCTGIASRQLLPDK